MDSPIRIVRRVQRFEPASESACRIQRTARASRAPIGQVVGTEAVLGERCTGEGRPVCAAIKLVEGVLEAGHAVQAIALAEHVMRRIDRALDRIDDSYGYVGVVVDRSADLHRRACEAARPDPRKLAARMLELALASSSMRI